jgi:hypothetical protein
MKSGFVCQGDFASTSVPPPQRFGADILYENPPLPPFGKGGTGGFSSFVVPAPGMGVCQKFSARTS